MSLAIRICKPPRETSMSVTSRSENRMTQSQVSFACRKCMPLQVASLVAADVDIFCRRSCLRRNLFSFRRNYCKAYHTSDSRRKIAVQSMLPPSPRIRKSLRNASRMICEGNCRRLTPRSRRKSRRPIPSVEHRFCKRNVVLLGSGQG